MTKVKFGSIAAAVIAAAVFALSRGVQASLIFGAEVGDDRASATSVEPYFDLSSDPNIFNSTEVAHVSVSGTNDSINDVDWYSFTGSAGATVYFDIDCGFNCGVSFDPTLSLFDSAGTLLAFGDDSSPADTGSTHHWDSFVGTFILPSSGTYYVAVSNYDRFPNSFGSCSGFSNLTRPDENSGGQAMTACTVGDDSFNGGSYNTGDYTLHLSNSDSDGDGVPDVDDPCPFYPETDCPKHVSVSFPQGQLQDYPDYRWRYCPTCNPADSSGLASSGDPPAYSPPFGNGWDSWQTPAGRCEMNNPHVYGVDVGFRPNDTTGGFACCTVDVACGLCNNVNGAGVNVFRWGSRAQETPIDPDADGLPDQCGDNCPQIANDTQTDTDGDQRGDSCDSFPNHRYQCADTEPEPDNCDDCKSGSFNPNDDHNPCINPAPEPHTALGLVAGAILVGALARRKPLRA